jgi:hypothetical protein
MNLAKAGTYAGLGMMTLGAVGRITGRLPGAAPKEDPMGKYIDEASGSLIVFGFAIGMISIALSKTGEKTR